MKMCSMNVSLTPRYLGPMHALKQIYALEGIYSLKSCKRVLLKIIHSNYIYFTQHTNEQLIYLPYEYRFKGFVYWRFNQCPTWSSY